MMYLNSSSLTQPVQFTDLNGAVQQQPQVQYSIMNFTPTGMLNATPITVSPTSTQLASSTGGEALQQQVPSSQSSNLTSHPSLQQIHLENLYNNVLLREKNPNQTYDPRKTRKRLSDPVYPQQQPLQPLFINQQQYLSSSNQQYSPNTAGLTHDPSTHSLARRRSLRLIKPPTFLQTIPQEVSQPIQREPQKLLVVRHAERVDSTFGAGWLDQVFEKNTGIYRRLNLNLPKKMVNRREIKDFLFDPPITELGLHECKMIGEELASQGIRIQHVYASPALRCVQTADKILEGLQMRDEIPIRIEPCLFEFLKWYPAVPAKWPFLDLDELTRNGYHVDQSYKPFYPMESLRKDEDESMYYRRSHFIVTSILKNHELEGGNLLIVGHVSVLAFESFSIERRELVCLGADDRSVYETTDRWSSENQRIEVSCSSCSVSLDALRGQTKRWNVESDETADLPDQTRRCRTVRLEIFPLSLSLLIII